jgi:hypothetical protein
MKAPHVFEDEFLNVFAPKPKHLPPVEASA